MPAKRTNVHLAENRRNARLDSEAFAALGAPRGNNSAAATRFHAGEKAVCAGAFDFGRLIGAFHDVSSACLKLILTKYQGNP
jgi:hypothetical protein